MMLRIQPHRTCDHYTRQFRAQFCHLYHLAVKDIGHIDYCLGIYDTTHPLFACGSSIEQLWLECIPYTLSCNIVIGIRRVSSVPKWEARVAE